MCPDRDLPEGVDLETLRRWPPPVRTVHERQGGPWPWEGSAEYMDSRRVRLSAGLLRAAGAVPEGGRPKAGLADAGYWSEANIRACSWPEMPELLIATTKDWKQRKMLREKGCPRGRIPKGLSPWDRMERKLLTKRGRALYKKRGVLVEPVFGQVKEGQGFRRFMRQGLGAARRLRLCYHLSTSRTRPVSAVHRPTLPWTAGRHAEP